MLTTLRRFVPPPVQMIIGLGVFGLAGYLFVALTGRTLATEEANLAISFYFVVNVVGAGIFYAVEQITSRSISGALTSGHELRPVFLRVFKVSAGLVSVVVLILLALTPVIGAKTLHGDWALFAIVLVTPVVAAALSLVRGLLGGMQRFSGYAVTLTVEGIARLGLCVLLVVLHVGEAWIFGAVFLGGSLVAALVGLLWLRKPAGAGETAVAGGADQVTLGKSLAALAVANLLAQLLPNIAPLAVSSRLPLDSAVALAFGQAVVIARLPLLAFFPIQTMLLPGLTAAVTRGELHVVARRIKLTLGAVVGLGALYSIAFVVFGPWIMTTFMNPTFELDTLIMLLLAVSTVVLISAFAVQPALVALGKDKTITLGWAIGSAITLAMVLLPGEPATIAAAAQVAGPLLTVVVVLLGLRIALRTPAVPEFLAAEAARK